MNGRLLIEGGLVLAHAGATPAQADILVEDGRVLALLAPGSGGVDAAVPRLDAADRLVIPGLVNGHTHAHGALGRGAVEDVALEGFLAASPAINGQRGLDDLALSATLNAVELLRKGCTALFDMPAQSPLTTVDGLHAVAGAYARAGIRAVVAPMLADRTLYQAYPELLASLPAPLAQAAAALRTAAAADQLAAVEAAARDWPFDAARVRLGVAPTIALHCSDALLRGCARLSEAWDLPMQTHLAESKAQAVFGEQRYGKSLVAHLAELGLLSPRLSTAHTIWVGDDDLARLAAAGVTAIHNPLSNLRLGSGIAPVRRMLKCGLRVGVGSDGANTSDTQNLFEAMRLAAYLSRVTTADEADWIGATEALRMATEGSAHALGWGERLGRIESGREADLVLLDLAQPVYVPLRHALRQMVHGENGAAVDRVLVGGELVVTAGKVLTIDEAALRRQAQAAAQRLDAHNAEGRNLAQAMRPWVSAFCCGVGRRPFTTSVEE
jgi:5-methylthioadenosine/S-adenosylhomocysteine deaminase